MKALIQLTNHAEAYCTRHFAVSFQNGDDVDITVKGSNITDTMAAILGHVSRVEINPDHHFSLSIKYYHVTDDDFDSLEVCCMECHIPDVYENHVNSVVDMVARLLPRFNNQLARYQIKLTGVKGSL